jgi:hypothetical protein
MNLHPLAWCPLFFLALGASAQAAPIDRQFFTGWHETGAVTFHSVVVGRFGGAYPDAVVLRALAGSKRAIFLQDPYRFRAWNDLGEAKDLALVPGGLADGRDALAMLVSADLRICAVSSTADVQAALTTNGWPAATRVWCGEVVDGVCCIYGHDPAQNLLLRASYTPATGTLAHVDATTVPVGVSSLHEMQWDATGPREIVLHAGEYAFVCNQLVQAIHYLPLGAAWQGTAPRVAVSRGAGTTSASRDQLVAYFRGVDQFYGFAVNSTGSAWYPLGERRLGEPRRCARADGYDDLVFPVLGAPELFRLRRGATTPFDGTYAGSIYTLLHGEALAAAPAAALACADIDGDTDADILACQSFATTSTTQTVLDDTVSGLVPAAVSAEETNSSNGPITTILKVRPPTASSTLLAAGGTFKWQVEAWLQPGRLLPMEPARLGVVTSTADLEATEDTFPVTFRAEATTPPPNGYVLLLHVSLQHTRMVNGVPVTTTYPSLQRHLTEVLADRNALHYEHFMESTGEIPPWTIEGGPPFGGGDHTSGGNNNRPPIGGPITPP